MAFTIKCPECGAALRVPEERVGRRGKCPKCGRAFVISSSAPTRTEQSSKLSTPHQPSTLPARVPSVPGSPGGFQRHGFRWLLGAGGGVAVLLLVVFGLIVLLSNGGATSDQPSVESGDLPRQTPTEDLSQAPYQPRQLPEAPQQLAFSPALLAISPGDQWEYVLLTGDTSLDAKVLTFTFEKRENTKLHFSARLGDAKPHVFSIEEEAGTWFFPSEVSRGVFEAIGIGDEHPETVQRPLTWTAQHLSYTYDGPFQHAHGYRTIGTGPSICAVPAGDYACAKFLRADVVDNKATRVGEYWLTPEVPFALRCRWRRAESVSLLLMELRSYRCSGEESEPSDLQIPRTERQKLIDWAKAHDKHGEDGPLVEDLLALFHMALQDHPGKGVQWTIGSNLTKDDKGYVLELQRGRFRVVKEIALEDENASSRSQLKQSFLADQ